MNEMKSDPEAIKRPIMDDQYRTYTIEEALILMGSMSLGLSGYEKLVKALAKMCEKNSVHKHRSGAQVIKHLQNLMNEHLTEIYETHQNVLKRTGDLVHNKAALSELLVTVGDLASMVKEDHEKTVFEAERNYAMSKYGHEVVGDAVESHPVPAIEIPTPEQMENVIKNERRKNTEALIEKTVKNSMPGSQQ